MDRCRCICCRGGAGQLFATCGDGLEDASKYPNLVAELWSRGWSTDEMRGVLGGNLMRIMDKVDEVSERMKGERPSSPPHQVAFLTSQNSRDIVTIRDIEEDPQSST